MARRSTRESIPPTRFHESEHCDLKSVLIENKAEQEDLDSYVSGSDADDEESDDEEPEPMAEDNDFVDQDSSYSSDSDYSEGDLSEDSSDDSTDGNVSSDDSGEDSSDDEDIYATDAPCPPQFQEGQPVKAKWNGTWYQGQVGEHMGYNKHHSQHVYDVFWPTEETWSLTFERHVIAV